MNLTVWKALAPLLHESCLTRECTTRISAHGPVEISKITGMEYRAAKTVGKAIKYLVDRGRLEEWNFFILGEIDVMNLHVDATKTKKMTNGNTDDFANTSAVTTNTTAATTKPTETECSEGVK